VWRSARAGDGGGEVNVLELEIPLVACTFVDSSVWCEYWGGVSFL